MTPFLKVFFFWVLGWALTPQFGCEQLDVCPDPRHPTSKIIQADTLPEVNGVCFFFFFGSFFGWSNYTFSLGIQTPTCWGLWFWRPKTYLTHQTSEFEVRILSECPMHRRTPSTLGMCRGGWRYIYIKVAGKKQGSSPILYLVGANLVTLLLKVTNLHWLFKSTALLQYV